MLKFQIIYHLVVSNAVLPYWSKIHTKNITIATMHVKLITSYIHIYSYLSMIVIAKQ